MDSVTLNIKYEKGKLVICFFAIIIGFLGFSFDLIAFLKIYTTEQLVVQVIGVTFSLISLIGIIAKPKKYRIPFLIAVYNVPINIFMHMIANETPGGISEQTNIVIRDMLFIVAYMSLSGFILGPKHLFLPSILILILILDYAFIKKNQFIINNVAILCLSTIGFTVVMHFFIRMTLTFVKSLGLANAEIITQKEEISAQHDMVLSQKAQIEKIHRNVSDSIAYAKYIQEAMLPDRELLVKILPESFLFFKPKDVVSGDFYWVCQMHQKKVVVVADCTGHGVPGALMSVLGISFLREIVQKQNIAAASQVLNILRDSVIDALKQSHSENGQTDGMDMAICCIDNDTNLLQFAGANNPVYITGSASTGGALNLTEIKGDKMPVGIFEYMAPFTNHEVQLQKGQCIYLMSDGFEDQFGGEKGQKFYSKNVKNLLLEICCLDLPDQQLKVEAAFKNWINPTSETSFEQVDDITILGFRV